MLHAQELTTSQADTDIQTGIQTDIKVLIKVISKHPFRQNA